MHVIRIKSANFTHMKGFMWMFKLYSDISQGVYAVVEYADPDSVFSLMDDAVFPYISHESVVPFKSRLLSLRNISSPGAPDKGQLCHPQTTIPIHELIQRLSKKESVSYILPGLKLRSGDFMSFGQNQICVPQ